MRGPWDMGNLYVFADGCEVSNSAESHHRSPIDVGQGIERGRNLPITSPLCGLLVDTYIHFYHALDDESGIRRSCCDRNCRCSFVFAVMRSLFKRRIMSLVRTARLRDKCGWVSSCT